MNLDFHNVDRLCGNAVFAGEEISLDLSQVDFISPFALVYLGLYIRNQKQLGRSFHVNLPHNLNVKDYLERQGFFRRFEIPILDPTPEEFLYSIPMVDIKSDPGLADEYSEKLKDY